MKKLFVYSATMALCSPVIFAAQQTWTGQISDAMCKSDHAMMQKGATKMSDKECAMACAKSGQKYIPVSDGKVFQIENQTVAGLAANARRHSENHRRRQCRWQVDQYCQTRGCGEKITQRLVRSGGSEFTRSPWSFGPGLVRFTRSSLGRAPGVAVSREVDDVWRRKRERDGNSASR